MQAEKEVAVTSEARLSRPGCMMGATAYPSEVEDRPSQLSCRIRPFNADSETTFLHHLRDHSVPHSDVAWHHPQERPGTSQLQNASAASFNTLNMVVAETSSNSGGNSDLSLARARACTNAEKTRNGGKKGLSCPFCPYSSIYTTHVRKHIRVHTKERPFRCNVCSRAFSQKENLVKHTRTHASHPRLE